MSMAIARIVMRYASGALLMAGYLSPSMAEQLAADPDVLMLVGAGIALATETFYALARKQGWAT